MSSDPESLFEDADNDFEDFAEALDGGESPESLDEIGTTSAEAEPQPAPATTRTESSRGSSRRSFLKSLTIYDAMLIASAASILIACLLLMLELSSFGGPFFQWRTSEALVEALTPP